MAAHQIETIDQDHAEAVVIEVARQLLDQYGRTVGRRDGLVTLAHQSGVSKSEIARRTGIARTTIDRILAPL